NVKTDELFTSPQLYRLTGQAEHRAPLTRTQWVAQLPIHPDDRMVLEQATVDHVAGRTPRLDAEYRVIDANGGTIRWLHTRRQCFREEAGRPDRVGGATVEITQRKRAEESLRQSEQALRQSEARYQLAVDGANQGLWDWDLESDMQFVSPRAQE